MDKDALTRVWTASALVMVFYSLNTWLSSQGADIVFDIELLDERREVGALFGLLVCAPLLIIVTQIGSLYARRFGSEAWHTRLPVVGLDKLDTSSKEGRVYQAFILSAFIILPAMSLLHFINITFRASVIDRQNGSEIHPFTPVSPHVIFTDRYRLGEDGGVTFFPLYEPIFLLILTIGAFTSLAAYLWQIFFINLGSRRKA